MRATSNPTTNSRQSGNIQVLKREVLELLRVDPKNQHRLISRENSRLEYKETFDWRNKAKYAKTMAAFSNSSGGFIVFGVKDSPRELKGVNTNRFEKIKTEEISEYLNSVFSPELVWEAFSISLANVELGILAIRPSEGRPVVCTKNEGKELRDSDIYYRYRGRSERIRYPELQKLLAERVERERDAWLAHLSRVARIGVENVGVLDLVDGELSGRRGRLLVSKELLQKAQLIREGNFTETDNEGAPTLRIVGDVEIIAPGAITPVRTIAQPLVLGEKEIMLAFLRQERTEAPTEYIKQACREASAYQPIYHFATSSKLEREALYKLISKEAGRNSPKLLERINGVGIKPLGRINGSTPSSAERQTILAKLEATENLELHEVNHIRLLEAVTHFTPNGIPTKLFQLLEEFVKKFDELSSRERSHCRKAVAHLDEALNRSAYLKLEEHELAS